MSILDNPIFAPLYKEVLSKSEAPTSGNAASDALGTISAPSQGTIRTAQVISEVNSGPAHQVLRANSVAPRTCTSLGDIMRRVQYRKYVGLANTGSTFPYVLSDAVPTGKFWILMQASAVNATQSGVATSAEFGLWLLPPQASPLPTKLDGTDPFFSGYLTGGHINNNPPPRDGIRIDSFDLNPGQVAKAGGEQSMMGGRDKHYIAPQWVLMAYMLNNQTALAAGNGQVELRIAFAEFDVTEDANY